MQKRQNARSNDGDILIETGFEAEEKEKKEDEDDEAEVTLVVVVIAAVFCFLVLVGCVSFSSERPSQPFLIHCSNDDFKPYHIRRTRLEWNDRALSIVRPAPGGGINSRCLLLTTWRRSNI